MPLTVAQFQERSQVLGPGVRTVVWFHGCSRNCPDCIAHSMNLSTDYEIWTPENLAGRIACIDSVEGITLSGGEPFEQDLGELMKFIHLVRQKTSLSMMAYTGFLLDELKKNPEKAAILDELDILVDGPYVHHLNDGSLWKGSANQTLHFLSDRYVAQAEYIRQSKGRDLEIKIGLDAKLSLTGIPPQDFKQKIENELKKKKLEITW